MQEKPGWAVFALHMNHTLFVVTLSRNDIRMPWGCSLGKSYSVPALPWRRCLLISVLLMKMAQKMLWCTARWQFISWDAAVNSLGMLMALISIEAVSSTDTNTVTPEMDSSREVGSKEMAVCFVLAWKRVNSSLFMYLDSIKICVLSGSFPFLLWGEYRSQSSSWHIAWMGRWAFFPGLRMVTNAALCDNMGPGKAPYNV